MSKFAKGKLPVMVYYTGEYRHAGEPDIEDYICDDLGQYMLAGPYGVDPLRGWSARFPGDTDIEGNIMLNDSIAMFSLCAGSKDVSKSAIDAACRKAEEKYKEEHAISILSRQRLREIKEQVVDILSKDAPVSFESTDVVWMIEERVLLIAATSVKKADAVVNTFYETFSMECQPFRIGATVPHYTWREHEPLDIRQDDTGAIDEHDGVISRDFLMWLWYMCEDHNDPIMIQLGDEEALSVSYALDGPLHFVNESGSSSQVVKISKGTPTLSAEAHECLIRGKKLVKAKVSFGYGDTIYSFMFDAATDGYVGLSLPDGECMDATDRIVERLEYICELDMLMRGFVARFTTDMLDVDARANILAWAESRIYMHH